MALASLALVPVDMAIDNANPNEIGRSGEQTMTREKRDSDLNKQEKKEKKTKKEKKEKKDKKSKKDKKRKGDDELSHDSLTEDLADLFDEAASY